MALTIERVSVGCFRVLFDGEIDAGQVSAVRHGLASVLLEQPDQVEVQIPSVPTDGVGWGLLRSFSDILWARGCRIVLMDATGSRVSLSRMLPSRPSSAPSKEDGPE
jgi:hypothetical protein